MSTENNILQRLDPAQSNLILATLKTRFEKNMDRHRGLEWAVLFERLVANEKKLFSLNEMEKTGGEPDVVDFDSERGEFVFYDCSAETPKGRRSICYDRAALDSRKEFKPNGNVLEIAEAMGIEVLDESQYRYLQRLGQFDLKTSSWILTPEKIRTLGGAIFCDRRYDTVFVYHNGASSYYAARAFRGMLKV